MIKTLLKAFYKGNPYYGKAAFINGYNGYTSTETDGCLCALIDRSCFDKKGKPNYITDKDGNTIKLKNRRGDVIELKGNLMVFTEDM